MTVALHFQKLSKKFDNLDVLSEIDLKISKGDFVAILGPSGSGKSTLLKTVAGLEVPSQGRVEISENLKKERAYVFQDPHLLPWRTVEKNIHLPLEFKNKSSERMDEILDLVRLKDFRNFYPAQLSGGMKMRVSLARALITHPELLMMDEPFAALDEMTRFRLDEELRNLWVQKRMTVLFVTHSVQEAVFVANRVVVLSSRPGKIIFDHFLDLPEKRENALRTSESFVRELRFLQEKVMSG